MTTTATADSTRHADDDLSVEDIVAIERGLAEPGIVISAAQLEQFLACIGGERGLAAFLAIQPLRED